MTITIDRFQGDPKMYLDENGSYLDFRGGQPVMDAGLENAANISLFTRDDPKWGGNVLVTDPNEKIGAKFEKIASGTITVQTLNDTRDASEKALTWMINAGIAGEIIGQVSNPTGSRMQTAVLIRPVGDDPIVLLATKNGANWQAQAVDPAHGR
jgi:phage gp46-like protein